MHQNILQELTALTDGLLFISESESSVEVVQIAATDNIHSTLQGLAKVSPSEKISEQPLEDILLERSNPPENADPFDIKQAPIYRQIFQLLKSQLIEAKTYRIGNGAPQALYLIGKSKDGSWIGIKTTTIDT